MTMTVTEFCDLHKACQAGREWGQKFGSMADAYDAFLRGEGELTHMIWVYVRAVPREHITSFACFCARQNWSLLVDERSRRAVEIAEAFVRGDATTDDCRKAAYAAAYAAHAAAYAAAHAAYAAYAAAYAAAHAAAHAAYAAYAAAYAAHAAAYAAAHAAYAAEDAVSAAEDAAYAVSAAKNDQREYLVKQGNPFTEVKP
jgi:hypothetical protein